MYGVRELSYLVFIHPCSTSKTLLGEKEEEKKKKNEKRRKNKRKQEEKRNVNDK